VTSFSGSWRAFREGGHAVRVCDTVCERREAATSRKRFLSRGSPARLNICRFSILGSQTRPSTMSELQFVMKPAVTASRSVASPSAKPARPGSPLVVTSSIQVGSPAARRPCASGASGQGRGCACGRRPVWDMQQS